MIRIKSIRAYFAAVKLGSVHRRMGIIYSRSPSIFGPMNHLIEKLLRAPHHRQIPPPPAFLVQYFTGQPREHRLKTYLLLDHMR
jgi:hypothetical protein